MTDDGNVYYIQGRTVFHTQDVILSFGIKTPEWQQQNQKYLQRKGPSGQNNTVNGAVYVQ